MYDNTCCLISSVLCVVVSKPVQLLICNWVHYACNRGGGGGGGGANLGINWGRGTCQVSKMYIVLHLLNLSLKNGIPACFPVWSR